MLSDVLGVDEDDPQTPTKYAADRAISAHAESVRSLFTSLAEKLPRFSNFVEVGLDFEGAVLGRLQAFNASRQRSKAVVIGLKEPVEQELERIIQLLEYSGMVRRLGSISRGEKGVFERLMLHYAVIMSENALSLGRSPSVAGTVEALEQRDAAAFVRSSGSALLGPEFQEQCTLDLAPCPYCGTPRVSEDARFCMRCGRELSDASIYEELLRAKIERLPLTHDKLQRLHKYTDIRTVQDVLLDDENRKLLAVPWIGPIWAKRIKNYADEFVSL